MMAVQNLSTIDVEVLIKTAIDIRQEINKYI
jgi:hypothetical protein